MAVIRAALCNKVSKAIENVIMIDDTQLDKFPLSANQVLVKSDDADFIDSYDIASGQIKKAPTPQQPQGALIGVNLSIKL